MNRWSQLTLTRRGPAVDVKLTALQVGQFGSPFAMRFAPLTFCVAIGCAVLTGWWVM